MAWTWLSHWAGLVESLVVELNSSRPALVVSDSESHALASQSASREHLAAAAAAVFCGQCPNDQTTASDNEKEEGECRRRATSFQSIMLRTSQHQLHLSCTGLGSPCIYNLQNYAQRICRREGRYPQSQIGRKLHPLPPVDAPATASCE